MTRLLNAVAVCAVALFVAAAMYLTAVYTNGGPS